MTFSDLHRRECCFLSKVDLPWHVPWMTRRRATPCLPRSARFRTIDPCGSGKLTCKTQHVHFMLIIVCSRLGSCGRCTGHGLHFLWSHCACFPLLPAQHCLHASHCNLRCELALLCKQASQPVVRERTAPVVFGISMASRLNASADIVVALFGIDSGLLSCLAGQERFGRWLAMSSRKSSQLAAPTGPFDFTHWLPRSNNAA